MSDFDRIFKKYHTSLFLYARKFVCDEGIALDLVQDVFTAVWEKKIATKREQSQAWLRFAEREQFAARSGKIATKREQSQAWLRFAEREQFAARSGKIATKREQSQEEYLKAYLFQSVRNCCMNHLKHEKIVQKHREQQILSLTELQYYQSGEKSLIEKENLDQIWQAIHSLSDIHREIIELSRFEGLRNKEIAERLNIPLRTVETRLFRALSALRSKLPEKTFVSLFFVRKSDNPGI
jgi:RNA polymerase sigma factor (sigma-70 family)